MVSIIVMVLGGGMGTIGGPVVGGIIFTLLPEFLRSSEQYRMLIYGVMIILFARFAPAGIWAGGQELTAQLKESKVVPFTSDATALTKDNSSR